MNLIIKPKNSVYFSKKISNNTNGTNGNSTTTNNSSNAKDAASVDAPKNSTGGGQNSILSHANINNAVDSLSLNSNSAAAAATNANPNVENQASIQ